MRAWGELSREEKATMVKIHRSIRWDFSTDEYYLLETIKFACFQRPLTDEEMAKVDHILDCYRAGILS